MPKTWLAADIHGHYLALKHCLDRAEFDHDNDTLIQLGDICDGWPYVYECVEELLKIKNLIPIRGNHDQWFQTYIETGIHPIKWDQGGLGTAKSYLRQIDKEHMITPSGDGYITALNPGDIPETHKDFFKKQLKYYIDNNNLFIHGGFNRHFPLRDQMNYIYYWDRDLWNAALSYEAMNEESKNKNKFKIKDKFNHIFIGHTSTTSWSYKEIEQNYGIMCPKRDPITTPMTAANITNLDTGCGSIGKLTFMNLETREIVQSDSVKGLYPNEHGK